MRSAVFRDGFSCPSSVNTANINSNNSAVSLSRTQTIILSQRKSCLQTLVSLDLFCRLHLDPKLHWCELGWRCGAEKTLNSITKHKLMLNCCAQCVFLCLKGQLWNVNVGVHLWSSWDWWNRGTQLWFSFFPHFMAFLYWMAWTDDGTFAASQTEPWHQTDNSRWRKNNALGLEYSFGTRKQCKNDKRRERLSQALSSAFLAFISGWNSSGPTKVPKSFWDQSVWIIQQLWGFVVGEQCVSSLLCELSEKSFVGDRPSWSESTPVKHLLRSCVREKCYQCK